MNAARLDRSKRLQRTLAALKGAGRNGATTLDLFLSTGSMAVHSDVAELRANGISIDCAMVGKNAHGRRVYRYTLASARGAA